MNRERKNKIKKRGLLAVMVIGLIAFLYGLSWILTCGVIKLITICFHLSFHWSIATGIWVILCFLKLFFKKAKNDKRLSR